jgi:hypothetical protein
MAQMHSPFKTTGAYLVLSRTSTESNSFLSSVSLASGRFISPTLKAVTVKT